MPNAELTRIEDGFAIDKGYDESKLEGESKHDFLLRLVLDYLTEGFVVGEGTVAGADARGTAETSARTVEITIN